MKKIFVILMLLFTARANAQPVASPNSVFKLIGGATFVGAGGTLVTFENLHLDNQGYLNSDSVNFLANQGSSTFRFSGDSTTSIGGAAISQGRLGGFYFDRLEIAKTGGAVFQLRRGIQIISSVDFSSGLLNLNGKRIILMNNSVLNGESESSRIADFTGGGDVVADASLSPNTIANPGNLGLEITPSSSTTTVPNPGVSNTLMMVSRGHYSQDLYSQTGTGSVLRYYRIIPCGSYPPTYCFNGGQDYTAKVRFKYFDGELNGLNENVLSMWESWPSIYWTHIGRSSYNTINNYVEQTITINYSPGNSPSLTLAPPPMGSRPGSSAVHQFTNSPRLPNEKNSWKTWPNPVSKTLWITIHATNKSKVITNIYDSKGALIRTRKDYMLAGSNLLNIDIKDLAAGIYHIRSEWNNGQDRASATFIKQ